MTNLDYVYVRAWGRAMGSHPSYIADQVAQARKDKAPPNATYKRVGKDGSWATMDDIQNNSTGRNSREHVEKIAAQLRGE
jgi:hypothetical protein